MNADYVSPFDDRARPRLGLAPRPQQLSGARVVLLDINKNRGSELLDRLELRFAERGARVGRATKETFSKPASPEVIDEVVRRADLVVEALAD
jgi:nucleotide-binding universal stress UspA family protein